MLGASNSRCGSASRFIAVSDVAVFPLNTISYNYNENILVECFSFSFLRVSLMPMYTLLHIQVILHIIHGRESGTAH